MTVARASVHAERIVDCPFEVAHDYAADFFRAAERGGSEAVVRAGPLRRRVALVFGLRSDIRDPGRSHEEIAVQWSAGTRLLPDFSGTLRMRINGVGTRLVLDGSYVPPGGRLGSMFDALVGNRIAAATARGLLVRVGDALSDRERIWRRGSMRNTA